MATLKTHCTWIVGLGLIALAALLIHSAAPALGQDQPATESTTASPFVLTPALIKAASHPIKKVSAEREKELRAQIQTLEAIEPAKRTVDDYLELSADYYELAHATFAVRNANAALALDRDREASYVALIKAQCINLHEVVYAEENYQFAKKKFPNSPSIEALNLDLFYGQMKFGQPFVAAAHLVTLLEDQAQQLGKSPDKEKSEAFVQVADGLVKAFEHGRAPEPALARVQARIEELSRQLDDSTAKGLEPLVKQLTEFRQELRKRYEALGQNID